MTVPGAAGEDMERQWKFVHAKATEADWTAGLREIFGS